MKRLKIINVVGTRPNFVKIAMLCHELSKVNDKIESLLLHTGQHYDYKMSREFFDSLNIPEPNIHLGVGSGNHGEQTAKVMLAFEPVCMAQKPDWVVVVGDVNSTMACAIVAKKLDIRVAHIEAGLRSFDMTMPEEINRKITDSLADLLFTPSPDGDENLIKEGVDKKKIKRVGNIMIDTLVSNLEKIEKQRPWEKMNLKQNEFVFVTLHRPSNVDDSDTLGKILENLANLAKRLPVVFPAHPRTLQRINEFGLKDTIDGKEGFHLIEPVSYYSSISYVKNAKFVITDSGGLQEETTYLGTPCLTLRPNTERPITITDGTNKLTSLSCMREDIQELLAGGGLGSFNGPPPLWDGNTAKRIVEVFLTF